MSVSKKGRFGALLVMSFALLVAAAPVNAATTKFGSKFSNGEFPDNAYQGNYCDEELDGGSGTYACTWILNEAANGGMKTAPKNGYINKVQIINGKSGSFKFVIAAKNASGKFKVLRRSTTISYATDQCNYPTDCVVHTFSISPALQISTGNYIGIQTNKTSMLDCNSGGNRIALFTPVLNPGGAYETPDGYSDCWLFLRAVYRP